MVIMFTLFLLFGDNLQVVLLVWKTSVICLLQFFVCLFILNLYINCYLINLFHWFILFIFSMNVRFTLFQCYFFYVSHYPSFTFIYCTCFFHIQLYVCLKWYILIQFFAPLNKFLLFRFFMFYFFTNILCLSLVIFAIFIHNYVSIYTKILWYFLFNIVMLCKVPACGYLDGALLSDFDMVWDTGFQSDFF